MNYTSIKQSEHLLELGLKPETADMYYPHLIRMGSDTYDKTPAVGECDYPYELPCWSISALLELIEYDYYIETSPKYHIYDVLCELPEHTGHKEDGNTLLESTYNMIVWLLQNNYIKTE